MTFRLHNYIPCLRWKQGEYQAVLNLSTRARDSIVPIIEIAEPPYDFELGTNSKTIDQHLFPFAKRVREKWGKKECYVDLHYIESSELMSDGQNPGTFVFNDLRVREVLAIPVIRMKEDPGYKAAFKQAVTTDGRGLCLRANIEEVARKGFDRSVQDLIRSYDSVIEQSDLIIDLLTNNFEPINEFAVLLANIIKNLPYLELWRSIGIISTSFPSTLAGLKPGISTIPRNEWRLYKLLVANLKKLGIRLPSFGDYAINHPDPISVDMRLVKPNGSVRYTLNDKWLIAKGQNVRDYGFTQYKGLCQLVVESEHYCGQHFSKGDKYIYACAHDEVSTGNLTTWRWIGTNHHIEMVARDVANLVAS